MARGNKGLEPTSPKKPSFVNRAKGAYGVIKGDKIAEEAALLPSRPGSDPDEHLWTRFSSRTGLRPSRQLPEITQEQSQEQAHYFYKGNPIAKRIINITAEYVIGDGINYSANDPRVKAILDAHWSDPTNNWSIYQFESVRDLGLNGELLIPVFVNPQNGHVTLGDIDTSLIKEVILDPDNARRVYAVLLKRIHGEDSDRLYRVINVSEASQDSPSYGRMVGLPTTDDEKKEFNFPYKIGDTTFPKHLKAGNRRTKWAGSCFFFKINSPISADRGWSDLLDSLDWIDAHDQYLFSQVEKAIESAKYIWDILLRGMSEEQQIKWLAKQSAHKPGMRVAHNENVEYSVKSPDLHLEDAAALANVLKNHILAGAGMPPIWFAESLVSRASAPEMTEPSFKHLVVRQRYVAYFISQIFRYALDMAILKSRLKVDSRLSTENSLREASFYLRMPDVSAKDQRMLAIVIKNVSGSLKDAVDSGFIGKEEASRLFSQYLELSGLDAWRNEPTFQKSPGSEPHPDFDPSRLFERARESGETEETRGDSKVYTFLDRNPNGNEGE